MPRRHSIPHTIYKLLFGRLRREHMRRPPSILAGTYKHEEIDSETSRVFATSHARSPHNVRALLKRHQVKTVDELMPLLPDNHYHVDPRKRLVQWIGALMGTTAYEPVVSRHEARLARQRRLPDGDMLGSASPPDKPP